MPKLFLIPNSINEEDAQIPFYIAQAIAGVRVFFVEEPKSARRLLKAMNVPLQECRYFDLNEHTPTPKTHEYLKILKKEDGGIISESGCPCVADPGSDLVLLAHQANLEIIPLIGPSSILLALMASGLNGQSFAFNGYLPKDKAERHQKIKALEMRSAKEKQTQVFMDTPYRNQNLFDDVLSACQEKTLLCVASDITGKEQDIKTRCISDWKKSKTLVSKNPTLFLINSPS